MDNKICQCCLNQFSINDSFWCKDIYNSVRVYRHHIDKITSSDLIWINLQSPDIFRILIDMLINGNIEDDQSPFSIWPCIDCYNNMENELENYFLHLPNYIDNEIRCLKSLQQLCAQRIDSLKLIRLIQISNIGKSQLF